MKLWVEPEIARRRKTASLPEDFKILRFLIRLPRDRSPIVEFNDEISWVASIKKAPGTSFEKGQKVFLHEVQKVAAVSPPRGRWSTSCLHILLLDRAQPRIYDHI